VVLNSCTLQQTLLLRSMWIKNPSMQTVNRLRGGCFFLLWPEGDLCMFTLKIHQTSVLRVNYKLTHCSDDSMQRRDDKQLSCQRHGILSKKFRKKSSRVEPYFPVENLVTLDDSLRNANPSDHSSKVTGMNTWQKHMTRYWGFHGLFLRDLMCQTV